MNGWKQWVRAPEPKGRYLVLFAALVFAFLLARNLLLPGAPTPVIVLINVLGVIAAHAIAKAVIESRAKS